MDLQNNVLLNVSSLTDTRNKLLNQARYMHASVKCKMPLKNDCSGTLIGKSLDLTSTELTDKGLFYKECQSQAIKKSSHLVKVKRKAPGKPAAEREKSVKQKKKKVAYESSPQSVTQMDTCDMVVNASLAHPFEQSIFGMAQQNDINSTAGFFGGLNFAKPAPRAACFSFGSPSFNYDFPAAPPGGAAFDCSLPLFGSNKEMFVLETAMPKYFFESIPSTLELSSEFQPLDEDVELMFEKKQLNEKMRKTTFLNVVNTSLMCSPNYKQCDDPFRITLINAAEKILAVDPEFLLKVALYARQELNIRSTSNFLLAYAAYKEECRVFLKKYFYSAINLPSDWLAVAEFYVTFNEPSAKHGHLPSMLRKVMMTSFSKFDEYQLAKYNKKKKMKRGTINGATSEMEKSFTLKQLIRTLHIASPVSSVMCLLGKKYPDNPKSFRECGLDGIWDSEKAGKRMKLPIPETWETKISAEGNKSYVWESLIENSKLPYMAMLRNLKNLIMTGISKYYHNKVMEKLTNKEAVHKSRQFPLRFYSAYKTIEEIENMKKSEGSHFKEQAHQSEWRKQKKEQILEKIEHIEESVLNGYKIALSKALEISALNNVDPISGKSVIICDIISPFKETADQPMNLEKVYQNCILLGLICFKACEDCEMKIIHTKNDICTILVDKQSILSNMSRILSSFECKSVAANPEEELLFGLDDLLQSYLNPQALLTKKINNIIFLHASGGIDSAKVKQTFDDFLHKYRNLANPNLLFVQVNLNSQKSGNSCNGSEHVNDIYLDGFSDQILKFIAEKGNGRQLTYIETIDQKYNLCEVDIGSSKICNETVKDSEVIMSPYDLTIKWKTLRLFISSTFKDMHGERDLLMQYAIQELKKRAFGVYVHISEIDLRWGVTEEYLTSKKSAEICIREAESCDIFVGVLGERYGTIYDFDTPDDPQLSWLNNYPPRSSITELEMEAGAFRRLDSTNSSLFYIRNNDFTRQVPKEWSAFFTSENEEAKSRLINLKDRIRKSRFRLVDGYHCHWGGVHKNMPFVAGLEDFGKKVLDDLWQLVLSFYDEDKHVDEISDEFFCQQAQMQVHSTFLADESSPLCWIVSEMKKKTGVFVISGQHGYGKTAFMVRLIKEIGASKVIPFFIGATSRSTDLQYMLSCISYFISNAHPGTTVFRKIMMDIVNQFPDILIEGASASKKKLILVIDGLDQLDFSAQKLSWLPCILPPGVTIILSASDSSEAYKTLLKRAQQGFSIYFAPLSPLNVSDRKELVKTLLAKHGKALDGSTFSNQMMQLITKTDCGVPLFIYSACNYLIMYATYDTLMNEIQNLPSTLSQLLEHVILQMEKHHKRTTVRRALILLCTTKEGLSEKDFHHLLSLAVCYSFNSHDDINDMINQFSDQDLLTLIDFRSLLHVVHIFMLRQRRVDQMKLSSSVFIQALRKIYSNYEEELHFCHQLLAVWYNRVVNQSYPLKSACCGLTSADIRSLPYHLYNGQLYQQLAEILCSLDFIEIMFKMHAADDILTYYLLMIELADNRSHIVVNLKESFDAEKLQSYYEFVSHNFHILSRSPQITRQQALNEVNLLGVNPGSLKHYVKCLTISPFRSCRWLTLPLLKVATSVAIHKTKFIAAIGNRDGYLKIFDHRTGKVATTLKVHSSTVTSLCFIGSDHMCTASEDNTLCIWNISDNLLVAVVKGHTRYISNCIVDPTEKFIISSSWDCSVRFWSAIDGRDVSVISKFKSPVNCIAHHPQMSMLACGLWNGMIQIWNTLSLKKDMNLEGHGHSIKAITYSNDGLNILSSSSSSDVFIWSTEDGLKIGSVKGHILPVNSLKYAMKEDFFVSASEDSTLKVWSSKGHLPQHTFRESKECVIHFMEIIRTNYLAVAFQNGAIWILDILEGIIVKKFTDLQERVSCFSKYQDTSDDNSINEISSDVLTYCGTDSGKILVLKSDNIKGDVVEQHNSRITYLLHANQYIFSGTSNGDVGLLHLTDKGKSRVVSGAHDGSVSALGFSLVNNQGWGLSASTDMTLKLWQVTSDEMSIYKTLGVKHKDYVTSCFFQSVVDQNFGNIQFITGSADNTVALWRDEEPIMLKGLHAAVIHVYCTDNYIIGCSCEGGAAIWTKSGLLVSQVKSIQEQTIALAYNVYHDIINVNDLNLLLAYADKYGSIVITRPFQRSLLCTLEGHSQAITSCSLNKSNTIISCSLDSTVNIWKISEDLTETIRYHDGLITAVTFLEDGNLFALSGDVNGNLVLWAISESFQKDQYSSGIKYCTHKKYVGGFINSLTTMKPNQCACASTITSETGTEYIISILRIDKCHTESSFFSIKEIVRHHVMSEILSMNYFAKKDTVIVGLKSGNIIIIEGDQKKVIKLTKNWILKMSLLPNGPNLCTVIPNGDIRQYSLTKLLANEVPRKCLEKEVFLSESDQELCIWVTAICTDSNNKIYVGDSKGWLKIIISEKVSFAKQIHADAITGIHVDGNHIVTCSLDKLIKLWEVEGNNQVGQFHSDVPISCMAKSELQGHSSSLLVIGSTVGKIHLLKWIVQ